jgi:predicted DNA-binding antitoxin AbrB/MazE fold protein
MSTTIEAIFENGMLRPLRPIGLQEGERVGVILLSKDHDPSKSREILERIASLPSEGPDEGFSGADHDSVLYPSK